MQVGQSAEAVRARPRILRRPALATSAAWARRLIVIVPPLIVALFAVPFIVRQNAWWEWQTPYWLLERQAAHVAAHGTPTFFLHTSDATFYPFNVFYAGPMFAVLAYPAALLGAWPVFVASIILAMVAGYLGIWWAAQNLGLSPKLAVLPALTYAAAPYMMALVYGRGAWSEMVGANGAAVALGAITALLCHPERGRRRALVALTLAAATIAGTHNLTLLMSGIVVPLIVIAMLPIVPRPDGVVGVLRRLGSAIAATALGIGLTAAWLVPNLWLGPHTRVANRDISLTLIHANAFTLTPSVFFSPWPRQLRPDVTAPWLYIEPSVLAIACGLLAIGVLAVQRGRHPGRVLAAIAGLLAVGAGLVVLMLDPLWWVHFPRLIMAVQMPYRLVPYLGMVAALAIAITLAGIRPGRARSWIVGLLTAAIVAQVALSGHVTVDSEARSTVPVDLVKHDQINVEEQPVVFSGAVVFTQMQFRIVNQATARPSVRSVAPITMEDPATSDHGVATGRGKVGQRQSLAVAWSPFVRIGGDVRLVGRDAIGLAVVRVVHTDPSGHWTARVQPRCTACLGALTGREPWQLIAGPLIALLSALTITAIGAIWLRRWRSERRAA